MPATFNYLQVPTVSRIWDLELISSSNRCPWGLRMVPQTLNSLPTIHWEKATDVYKKELRMAKITCRCLKFALSIDETEWIYTKWTTGLCTNIMSGVFNFLLGANSFCSEVFCVAFPGWFYCYLCVSWLWLDVERSKLDMHRFMGPDGMSSILLRELASVIVRPLSISFE